MNLAHSFQNTQAVFFDLDGTLIDTAPDFFNIINQMRSQLKLNPLPFDVIRNQVSNGAAGLVKACLNISPDHESFGISVEDLLDRYSRCVGQAAEIFSGGIEVLELLDQLSIPWGIVTNKPERFTFPLLEKISYGTSTIGQKTAVTICPDHVTQRKPHPESLHLAASQLSLSADACIYVGDHIRDIQAGNAANMTTIGIANGYVDTGDDPESWQADHLIAELRSLKTLLFTP